MKYEVEGYLTTTTTDEVEAQSEEEARQWMLEQLDIQHHMCGRPTDMVYGVVSVRPVEENATEEGESDA